MRTVKIEFASRAFVIEEGMLVIYDIPAAGLSLTTGIGIDAQPEEQVTGSALPMLGLFPSQLLSDGTTVLIDRPGEIRGMLAASKVRRYDGSVFSAAMEFKHEITPAELRSGLAVIDINGYKELVIRVRDTLQRPLAISIISLLRYEVEGSLDLHTNEDGNLRCSCRLDTTVFGHQEVLQCNLTSRNRNPTREESKCRQAIVR
jgi:hypothetical protein